MTNVVYGESRPCAVKDNCRLWGYRTGQQRRQMSLMGVNELKELDKKLWGEIFDLAIFC